MNFLWYVVASITKNWHMLSLMSLSEVLILEEWDVDPYRHYYWIYLRTKFHPLSKDLEADTHEEFVVSS